MLHQVKGVGALEFEPILNPFDETSTQLELNDLVKLAKKILQEGSKFQTNLSKKNNNTLGYFAHWYFSRWSKSKSNNRIQS